MTTTPNTEAYQKADGTWWLDVDPDDQENVYGDVSVRLAAIGSPAASVVAVMFGAATAMGVASMYDAVTAMCKVTSPSASDVNGGLVSPVPAGSVTFRITCVDGTRFDKTIHLNYVQF